MSTRIRVEGPCIANPASPVAVTLPSSYGRVSLGFSHVAVFQVARVAVTFPRWYGRVAIVLKSRAVSSCSCCRYVP